MSKHNDPFIHSLIHQVKMASARRRKSLSVEGILAAQLTRKWVKHANVQNLMSGASPQV
jgi:hypothetical protein